MLGTLVGILFALVLAAAVIFIVSRLNLGLTVDSFMTAIIAAAVITIIGGVIAPWGSPSAAASLAHWST